MPIFPAKKKKYRFFYIIFIVVILNGLGNLDASQKSTKNNQTEKNKKTKYNFSQDLFSNNIPIWEKIFFDFKGKPNLNYLEIGVFEGRSVIWMLENILTHPTTKVTCIDIFPKNLKEIFETNIEKSGFKNKVTTISGMSQDKLKHLPHDSFDIIYIDGSHTAEDVLADGVLSWPILKNNGILIFDDYLLYRKERPSELRPMIAIDAFITSHRNYIEIIHHKRQVFLKKQNPPFIPNKAFTPLGDYVYSWPHKKIWHSKTKREMELSGKEIELIEKLVKSRKYAKVHFSPDKEMLNDKDFLKLAEKLKLKLQFVENK